MIDQYKILDAASAFRRLLRDADQATLDQAFQALGHQLNTEESSRSLENEPLDYMAEAIRAEVRHRDLNPHLYR